MSTRKLELRSKREATSIKVDPELWKEAKIEAIRHDMEVSELVERALRKEIEVLKKAGEVKG